MDAVNQNQAMLTEARAIRGLLKTMIAIQDQRDAQQPVDPPHVVDNGDAQMILNFFGNAPIVYFRPQYADVNRDGFIENGDSQLVLSYFGSIIGTLPFSP